MLENMRMVRSVRAKAAAKKRAKTKSDIVPGFAKASICYETNVCCHSDLGNDVGVDAKTMVASIWIANVLLVPDFSIFTTTAQGRSKKSVVGDGKGKREGLDFLAIEDCTLEATYGTFGIREVTGIDTDGTSDSDNDLDPFQAIKAVNNSYHFVNSSLK